MEIGTEMEKPFWRTGGGGEEEGQTGMLDKGHTKGRCPDPQVEPTANTAAFSRETKQVLSSVSSRYLCSFEARMGCTQ